MPVGYTPNLSYSITGTEDVPKLKMGYLG